MNIHVGCRIGKKQGMKDKHRHFLSAFITITLILICGCGYYYLAKPAFDEANIFFNQGNYQASLSKYEEIIAKYPEAGDRALFAMGVIYAYPRNGQKDYQKSLACFQILIRDYPASTYRQDSEAMISLINDITGKDKRIIAQETRIETLDQEVKSKGTEIATQQKKIQALEQEVESKSLVILSGSADRILIEKKERRLTLFSKKNVIKTYKIALGGNPNGPKERQGDNKTPEGTYVIDSRNKSSRYHLSLHVSYPNEKDKRRAKELNVSPGGNIMIHGIGDERAWIGPSHAQYDWTKGCIAVTDKEIEEIDRLAPNGTIVEIRP